MKRKTKYRKINRKHEKTKENRSEVHRICHLQLRTWRQEDSQWRANKPWKMKGKINSVNFCIPQITFFGK